MKTKGQVFILDIYRWVSCKDPNHLLQMDNHYHLLLETPSGNLSQIMGHINGAYTTYFNVKRDRSGHLFQGRYKAILVDIDQSGKELLLLIFRSRRKPLLYQS